MESSMDSMYSWMPSERDIGSCERAERYGGGAAPYLLKYSHNNNFRVGSKLKTNLHTSQSHPPRRASHIPGSPQTHATRTAPQLHHRTPGVVQRR